MSEKIEITRRSYTAADIRAAFSEGVRHYHFAPDPSEEGMAAEALRRWPDNARGRVPFTREDVARILSLVEALDRANTAQDLLVELTVLDPEPWRNFAARIEALLPPEPAAPT